MNEIYIYLGYSGLLTIALWLPYITARLFNWGIPLFLNNYPEGFPEQQPKIPLWAQRSHRAHMNMVETMPAFIAVVLPAIHLAPNQIHDIKMWVEIFFYSRIIYSIVYTAGIPFLRTPIYLISWFSIIALGVLTFF